MIAGMVARPNANSILAVTRLGKDRVRRSNCWRLPLESLGQQVMIIYIFASGLGIARREGVI